MLLATREQRPSPGLFLEEKTSFQIKGKSQGCCSWRSPAVCTGFSAGACKRTHVRPEVAGPSHPWPCPLKGFGGRLCPAEKWSCMVEGQKGDSSGIYCLSAHYFSPEFRISLLKFYLFLSSLRCRLCLVCAGGAAGGSGQTLQEKPLSSR